MNDYKKLCKILKKGSDGEGSKGGHVVGHTRSGKPIYGSSSHESHRNFGSQDHRDAMNQHHEIWSKTQQKISNIRTKKPNWNPPKQVHDFLSHHYSQMQMHQNRASATMDKETRHKKIMEEPTGEIKGPHPYKTPQNIHKSHEDHIPSHSAVVVINPEKTKFLQGKRWKDDIWTSPAGGAHLGEFPIDTAIRETFEEANIMLDKEQLVELPMLYTKHLKPVYCFMAILSKDQMKKITEVNDPDEEIKKWKWFALEGEMPQPIDEKRFNTILNAKMKLAEMQKSFVPMDDMEGMTTISTADYSQENDGSKETDLIEQHMLDYQPGDEPAKIPLTGSTLFLVKIDDGLYSGFVKRTDKNGLMETVANIDKMTIPAIVQYLKAKQVIKETPKLEEVSQEDTLRQLLQELMPKLPKMIYVSMDGDNIGNRVAQAEARDDEDALMEFSRRINAGQTVFQTWAQSVGGTVIEGGGDEALAKVPESARAKIEFFRSQYEQVVGATVTVGVGDMISQATKARELGKLKGKNRTEVFIPMRSDEELKELYKPKDASQKLRDSGVLELTKALLRKGGPLPEGTVRQWGVNKYVKHSDGWVVIGGEHNGKLMGSFTEEPSHEDYARHHSKSSIKTDEEITKSSNRIVKLTLQLQNLSKSMLPTGSVRIWAGQKFIKQGDGHWMPMGNSSDERQNPPKSETPKIPADANSSAVAEPKDSVLKHLMPEKNAGGHVSIHSDDLKTALKEGPISMISGGRNHESEEDRGMTDEQISKRHKKLEEELKDSGHKFTKVKGNYGGKEDSLMVFHPESSKINELGKKYNQKSVLHSKDGKHKMQYVNGEHEGKHHKGSGYEEVPEAKDYFSEVNTTDGKKMKFNLGMDFGKHHKENE